MHLDPKECGHNHGDLTLVSQMEQPPASEAEREGVEGFTSNRACHEPSRLTMGHCELHT